MQEIFRLQAQIQDIYNGGGGIGVGFPGTFGGGGGDDEDYNNRRGRGDMIRSYERGR